MIFHHGILAGLGAAEPGVIIADLPATNLKLYLNSQSEVLTDSSGYVIGWNDISGNNVEVGPFIGNPYLENSGINGKPGVNTYTGGLITDNMNLGARTYYAVVQVIADNPGASWSALAYQNNDPYYQLQFQNGGAVQVYVGGYMNSGLSWEAGVPMVVKCAVNTTQNQITINGVAGAVNSNTVATLNEPMRIGYSANGSNFLLGALAIYSGVPSSSDDAIIQNALKSQFGITY